MARDNQLAHYGVKGMKWGVRKDRKKSSKPKKKKVSEMSDEELEARVKRLRKETEYNRLNRELKSGTPSATVKKILVTSGTVALTAYSQKYMKSGLDALTKAGYASVVNAQAKANKRNQKRWLM